MTDSLYRFQPRAADLGAGLRRVPLSDSVWSWVERGTGATIVSTTRLPGATSSIVHLVRFRDRPPLVLRRYVWDEFLVAEPDAPRREVDVLEFVSRQGLPSPKVVAADVSGQEVGDGTPAVLMTRIPGRPVASAPPARLAELAASIHSVDPAGLGHDYFPWCRAVVRGAPPVSRRYALWERAISLWNERMPEYAPVLVHRDFHPGNVLWSRRRLTGVVDWVNACRGPRGCDLAHCRANLLELAGEEAGDEFLAAYKAETGVELDPYWELASVLEHDPAEWTAASLARAEPRLERGVRAMGG